MKKLLILFLFLLSSLIIAGESIKEIPTATLAVQSAQSVYQNGDKVQISGEGFPADVEIVMTIISVQKFDGSDDFYILKNTDLRINESGELSGYVILDGLKEDDQLGEILISTRGANVKGTARFELNGNLPPAGPEGIMAGTFSFDEHNGNGYAELNEQLDITNTGTGGWTGPIAACWRRELTDGVYNGNQVSLSLANIGVDGSNNIFGYTNNGSTPYNDTRTDLGITNGIRLRIIDDLPSAAFSDNDITTVPPATPDHFEVTISGGGSTVTAGTGFSITVTAHTVDHNVVTDYVGGHTLNWTSDATASPDGTPPDLPGDGEQTFSAGVATVSGFTLYNSNPAVSPYIRTSDPDLTINTDTGEGVGAAGSITVNDATTAEVRIKTVDETAEEDYNNNIYGTATFQGPTQAVPFSTTLLYGVSYDAYGNLLPDISGTWTVGTGTVDGFFLFLGTEYYVFIFSAGPNAGTTYSGTLRYDIGGGITDDTGTIEVDDNDPATVTGFHITTSGGNPQFVFAEWSGTSSGDDDNTGTPVGYEIVWTDVANGPIDSEGEWNSATSVGSWTNFDAGSRQINMGGFPPGDKYFAMRTFDDVGNISVLGSGSYTTTAEYSLPVELVSFTSKADYDRVVLEWETASEVNNEGFFLYRSSQSDDGYEQLNSVLIPGNGNSNTSHQYEYVDKNVVAGQTYFYKLISRDFNGDLTEYESIVSATVLVAPTTFSLAQNFPNPFNPETHFSFSIAEPSRASLKIYNSLGQAIRTIFQNKVFDVGVYDNYSWDATDDAGKQVANGIYYYELRIPEQNIRQVKKMLFLK